MCVVGIFLGALARALCARSLYLYRSPASAASQPQPAVINRRNTENAHDDRLCLLPVFLSHTPVDLWPFWYISRSDFVLLCDLGVLASLLPSFIWRIYRNLSTFVSTLGDSCVSDSVLRPVFLRSTLKCSFYPEKITTSASIWWAISPRSTQR